MEPTRVPRGPASRLVFLFVTLVLTVAATGLLCSAIMSDHWEEINWDREDLIHANINLTWYLNGQVARLESSVNHRNKHRVAKSSAFLVPMHGGIWIMCVSLSGINCRDFYNVKLRPRTAHIFFVHVSEDLNIIHYIFTIMNVECPNVSSSYSTAYSTYKLSLWVFSVVAILIVIFKLII